MKYLTTRTRIAIGLTCLLVSVLLLATMLGVVPDRDRAVIEGRSALCEAIAVNSSLLVTQQDLKRLEVILQTTVRRNQDILSAAVRRDNGKVLIEAGNHQACWDPPPDGRSTATQVQVPIRAGSEKWGSVEIRFRPVAETGRGLAILPPRGQMVVFIAAVCFLLFLLYLKKMLEYLDPSKTVPGHVRSALDTLAEGLLVLDSRERIVLANHAFASIVGKSPEQLLGCSASQLPWTGDQESPTVTSLPWTTALQEKLPRTGDILRLRAGKSEVRTFMVNCSPVLGHKGDYRGVLASFDDVTQLEEKEVELKKSKEAAEAANRTKSEFLANMSHEIRTPMNAILGFTDVLRRGLASSETERQEYLATVHSSGKHLLRLINDILDLSKIEAGQMEVEEIQCVPHQLIAEIVTVLGARAAERGISLEYTTTGPIPETIQSDPTRLRQILTNLVGNAIKFTENGGVRVVARLHRHATRSQLAVDVIDTGTGIAAESLKKIFDPFSQADTTVTRRFGGTGLGLTISRNFAKALGGDLTVASELGKGSTFTVTIDTGSLEGVALLDGDELELRSKASSQQTAQALPELPPARVLVADDGEANRQLIKLVLTRAGMQVEAAANGQIAVQMAADGRFDLILMDMQMPVMDGYTATARLREQGLTIPIVALTAAAMKGDEEKCRAAGCSGFLTKPVDIDELMRCLSAELGGQDTQASDAIPPGQGVAATGSAAGERQDALPDDGSEPTSASQETEGVEGVIANPTATQLDDPQRNVDKRLAGSSPSAAEAKKKRPPLVSSLPMDDPEFRQIVENFLPRLEEQTAAMQAAWERRDHEQVAFLAHWLKGAGGTVGFATLSEMAKTLELLAKQGRADEIDGAIDELTETVDSIVITPAEPFGDPVSTL